MGNVIEFEAVTKRFEHGAASVHALTDFTLALPWGGIHGILGENGAGKSTLFRLLLGLIRADAGRVSIAACHPRSPDLIGVVGALVDAPSFFPHLSALQTLQMLACLHGRQACLRPDHLLAQVGLQAAAHRRVRGFSVGMKQRLGLAAALLCRPQVLILDEPTSGLDANGAHAVHGLIRGLADRDDLTVLLSSHRSEEVARLCDTVTVIRQGRLFEACRSTWGGSHA